MCCQVSCVHSIPLQNLWGESQQAPTALKTVKSECTNSLKCVHSVDESRWESTVFWLRDMMLNFVLSFYYILNRNKSKKIKTLWDNNDFSKTLACKSGSLPSFIFVFILKAKAKAGRRRRETPNQGKRCYRKHSLVT